LVLREFTHKDISKEYLSWLNDNDVVKYSELRHTRQNYKTASNYVDLISENNKIFSIVLNNGKHIGNITLRLDKFNLNADLSIMIGDKSYWGLGYAKQAIISSIYWLKKNTDIVFLIAGTMEINKPMISVFESLDFELSGYRRDYFKIEESRVDAIFYIRNILL